MALKAILYVLLGEVQCKVSIFSQLVESSRVAKVWAGEQPNNSSIHPQPNSQNLESHFLNSQTEPQASSLIGGNWKNEGNQNYQLALIMQAFAREGQGLSQTQQRRHAARQHKDTPVGTWKRWREMGACREILCDWKLLYWFMSIFKALPNATAYKGWKIIQRRAQWYLWHEPGGGTELGEES